MRNAARAFLDALSGTGSSVSIIDFSTSARGPSATPRSPRTRSPSVFEPYLKNGYKPSGWTNWEAAFQKVREANWPRGRPVPADLVVFITDGDPTARNNPPGAPVTGLVEGEAEALRPREPAGRPRQGPGLARLRARRGAAGPRRPARAADRDLGLRQYPAIPFGAADYTLVTDFDDLADPLRQIATELCPASVTVTKLVDEADGSGYHPPPDGCSPPPSP